MWTPDAHCAEEGPCGGSEKAASGRPAPAASIDLGLLASRNVKKQAAVEATDSGVCRGSLTKLIQSSNNPARLVQWNFLKSHCVICLRSRAPKLMLFVLYHSVLWVQLVPCIPKSTREIGNETSPHRGWHACSSGTRHVPASQKDAARKQEADGFAA